MYVLYKQIFMVDSTRESKLRLNIFLKLSSIDQQHNWNITYTATIILASECQFHIHNS